MLFMIYARFKSDAEEERVRIHEQFNEHMAQRITHLRFGGPVFDDPQAPRAGVLFILEAEDRAHADAFLAASPYVKAGLYSEVQLLELRPEIGSLG
jgi:uncharacterized protein YciI